MTHATIQSAEKRKWYELALRHRRMSNHLVRRGFADGAVFHAYHAYECVLSALIAANGYAVPPNGWTTFKPPHGKTIHYYPSPAGGITERPAHGARLLFFDQLADRTKPYYRTHMILRDGSMMLDSFASGVKALAGEHAP